MNKRGVILEDRERERKRKEVCMSVCVREGKIKKDTQNEI